MNAVDRRLPPPPEYHHRRRPGLVHEPTNWTTSTRSVPSTTSLKGQDQ